MLKQLLLLIPIISSYSLNTIPYDDELGYKTIQSNVVYNLPPFDSPDSLSYDLYWNDTYSKSGIPLILNDDAPYEYIMTYRLSSFFFYSRNADELPQKGLLYLNILISYRLKHSNGNYNSLVLYTSKLESFNTTSGLYQDYFPGYILGYGGGRAFDLDISFDSTSLSYISSLVIYETESIITNFKNVVFGINDFEYTFPYSSPLYTEYNDAFGYYIGNEPQESHLVDYFIDFGISYNDGYEYGETVGYDKGYSDGYDDGFINKGLDNWIVSLFNGMGNLLSIELLPNLTIGSIIMIFLAIPLTYAIIKLMKGGGD